MTTKSKYLIQVTDSENNKVYFEREEKWRLYFSSALFIAKLFDTYEEAEKTAKVVKKSVRKTSKVEITYTKEEKC
ncbi:hypothetical protein KIMC2_14620 [Xylocopilactobacillus apis]|uniref:DUF1508 domain-containing protein n=2 Tax=Xylocopilactobacillus apis TaxID=2932183 RepID=A0AAU9D3L0_9LACO|nr:hypothetical protein KIMC2_14620 [Xylocopilactobacillus apis]